MAERVLLVCTSTPANVQTAITVLEGTVFHSPEIELLCTPSEFSHYERVFPARKILVFPQRQHYAAAARLCRKIRKTNYDVVTVLWCRDVGRTTAKWFAFCCGGRRILVFNENLDCDYLKPSYLRAILASRMREGTLVPRPGFSRIRATLRPGFWGITRTVLAPLRFLILLISAGFLRFSKFKRET